MRPMHGVIPQLHDFLAHAAAVAPEKVALVCGRERLTYAALEHKTNALANTLVARGVERGDRVLVFGDNTVETVIAFWAALKANAVPSVISPLTKASKLAYLVNDCRPTALITEGHLGQSFREPACSRHLRTVVVSGRVAPAQLAALPGGLAWDEALAAGDGGRPPQRRNLDIDLAAIIYTSGSTGEPKGVMLSHRNMLTAAAAITDLLALGADDVILSVLPLSFNYGLYQMILAFRQGARLVLERSFAYPAHVLKVMMEEGATGFPGVPTIFAMLLELKAVAQLDLAKIRFVTNTAAALPVKHIQALKRVFPAARIYSMYGLTECKRCTCLPPEDLDRKPTSVGFAIPNTELWIVDENDQRVGPETVGQLVIRGATVMQGYWEKPEATARALRPGLLPGERVFYTGDYCKLDPDGYLYFVGRMDDIIKSRGEKVAPQEVETVLLEIPGVKEAAVIGVPDDILGQAVKAFVVPEQGATVTEQTVRLACQGKLESFMVPKYVELLAALPRTQTGKITKAGLH
jgi:amino acid adenylation domain-containing protein